MKLLSGNHMLSVLSAVALIALCLTRALCEASIENEPVKVTHRNSGPSYDIDDVERTRLNPDNAENTISNQPERTRPSALEQPDGETAPIGHLSIRRIFLVPMMPQQQSIWTRSQQDGAPNGGLNNRDQPSDELPNMAGANRWPLWPFMGPASPVLRSQSQQPHRHLFGADEASRPPKAEASDEQASAIRPLSSVPSQEDVERDESMDRLRPIFDPIRMMVDLMQQALNPANGAGGLFGDVGRETGPQPAGDNKEAASEIPSATEVMGRPIKPAANETKEEIVEIEGKKYLRKTVISRHVGENIIFMTRRLIFVPLNETDSDSTSPSSTTTTTTSTTTAVPSSTSNIADSTTTSGFSMADESTDINRDSKIDQQTTTTTSSPTTPASTITVASESQPTIASAPSSEAPITMTTIAQVPTSTKATESEETTPKGTDWTEKVSEAIDRVAERIVELGASNSSKPVVTEPATSRSS